MQFSSPIGIAVDGSGNVYVADSGNSRIQKFDSSGSFLTKWGTHDPRWVAVDGSGKVLVTACYCQGPFPPIQLFDSAGTLLANLGSEGSGVGQLSSLNGITFDGLGNFYVVDGYQMAGHTDRIQKFSLSE